jgi:hypothetical protein
LRPETTPVETLSARPSGLPTATTGAPTLAPPPRAAGTRGSGSDAGLSTATSCAGSAETTAADAVAPSKNVTVIRVAPAMTWFAVTIVPSSATITPEPSAWLVRTTTMDGLTRW